MDRYIFPDDVRAALEGLQQPLAVYQAIDGESVTLLVSDGFCRLVGHDKRDEAVRHMDNDMYRDTHPDDKHRLISAARQFMLSEEGEYDTVFRTRAGARTGYHIIHAHGKHVRTETGARLAQVWYMDEGPYTEGGEASGERINRELNSALHEESILRASQYDMLTGLPNLAYFFKLCEIGKARVLSEGKQGCLLYIDLNGMKYFNFRNGFAAGDRMLKELADLLASTFGHEDSCHIGADRFAISTTEDGIQDRIRDLFAAFEQMKDHLPVRIGIYSTALGDVPVSTAYDRAKVACDAIPKTENSEYRFYTSEMGDVDKRRRYIVTHIDQAIAERWIKVHCQAIVRAVNEKVCDEEALARWEDPEMGFLSPAEFIPQLEESGQIWKLDLYMLERVLEKIRTGQEIGMPVVPHSINLSRSDFDSCDIVEEIRRRVDDAGVTRSLITIEVTESMVGQDVDFMKKQVGRFRELGFPVWMDDFGTGYSSLDVLQSIRFDLIKFDMSFMRKLNEGDSARIILTELMRMATSLGVDTVCEGVETEEQVRFLQDIGCSKLQGFYYCKPLAVEAIFERFRKGLDVGFEDLNASSYFETVGRINLYDLDVIASQEGNSFRHSFNTMPIGIIEVRGDRARFMRSNPSYQEFIRRFFKVEMSTMTQNFIQYGTAFMHNVVRKCVEPGSRTFYDEKMPDGSVVHSFARRIGRNPVTGDVAFAVAVLSITEAEEGETYADIVRALAADYYNIYVVDLDTDRYIAYTSPSGREEMADVRHAEDFFTVVREVIQKRIYQDDQAQFLNTLSKENIICRLERDGVFTTVCRVIDRGYPEYVSLKALRLQGTNRVVLGFSMIDAQIRQREQMEGILNERDALARMMAISEDYMSLYSVDAETGRYIEYTASTDYETLGFAKEGEDFFLQGAADGKKVVHPEDLQYYLSEFTKENVLKEISETGKYMIHYRLVIRGEPVRVSLKIVPLQEDREKKLLAGVRRWRIRT